MSLPNRLMDYISESEYFVEDKKMQRFRQNQGVS